MSFVRPTVALAGLLVVSAALAAPKRPVRTAAPAEPIPTEQAAARVRDRALAGGSVAWDVLESLTTEIGPRPVGSPAMAAARDWAVARFKALGLQNVHVEPFTKEHAWVRGAESGAIVAPVSRSLSLIGLGGSVPTPAEGIEAEVVVFSTLEALVAAPMGSLAGRIALVNQPMTRMQDGDGYGPAVAARAYGPSIAAARGAIAYLTRSITTGSARAPHTGALAYEDGVSKIPAAALGVADADLLSRLVARGTAPRIKLNLQSSEIAGAPAWNVVGEVTGRDPAAGTIVIGGHLDSWDPGQGAIDDGAGVAITLAAAKLIEDLPVHPIRTIRVVAWGSEETGGSGAAYAAAHTGELEHLVLAGESDLGAGRVLRLLLPKMPADDPLRRALTVVLAPLRIYVGSDAAHDAGSDVEGLKDAGVPVFELTQDASLYFDIHHSADDTLDKVDRAELEQNVAAWAALLSVVGDSTKNLR
jgi:hypothetical protein